MGLASEDLVALIKVFAQLSSILQYLIHKLISRLEYQGED